MDFSKAHDSRRGSLPISSLLSPPGLKQPLAEPTSHNVTPLRTSTSPRSSFTTINSRPKTNPQDSTHVFPSPVSPVVEGPDSMDVHGPKGDDDFLFPSMSETADSSLVPLFNDAVDGSRPSTASSEPRSRFIRTRPPGFPSAGYGSTNVMGLIAQDEEKYLNKLRADNLYYMQQAAMKRIREKEALQSHGALRNAARHIASSRQPVLTTNRPPNRLLEPKSTGPVVAREQRHKRAMKRSFEAIDDDATLTARKRVSTPHKRAAPEKKQQETDFNKVPDYSPPIEILDHKPLKAVNISNPLDLSTDQNRQLLHESEVALAASLRLTCAQYLLSKRNIFKARLEHLRNQKPFLKTHAQKACSIDVNKASKMWTAFERVGWLDAMHFAKHSL